jgi:hypothetical protein
VSSATGASLPDPNTNIFQQGRLPTLPALSNTFESSRPIANAPGALHRLHRLSSDEQALERLPSITSTGVLVEREGLAALQQFTSEVAGGVRPSMSPTHGMMEAGTALLAAENKEMD